MLSDCFFKGFWYQPTPGRQVYLPLPEDTFYPLWEQLKEAGNCDKRIEVCAGFVKSLDQNTYIQDTIDLVYDEIVRNGVFTTLHEIANKYATSERTLQRKFTSRLVVSPKKLVRTVRINYLWKK